MKFVSKNSNLRIVLRPGIPANQMSGIAGQPGVYVKFQDGVVEVKDEEMIKKMHDHPGFNIDFIAVDESGEDPFAANREEIEPIHVIQDIRYGHAEGKRISPHKKLKLDPQIQKLVDDLAAKKMNEALPKMVEMTIAKMMEMADAKKEVIKKDEKKEEPTSKKDGEFSPIEVSEKPSEKIVIKAKK
jgi:hypothetical protein